MAALPRGMEHIDRAELYTSLPARVTYLQHFLEFGPVDDISFLVGGQKYIKQVIPAIVNMVYKKLLRTDITARVFSQRDSRDEENPDKWPSEEGSQIQHRKMFLRWYLAKLNSDPSKMEYWEYLDKVGLMHVGVGRRNPLHVDYIFLGACLGYIQDALTEAILSHPRLELQRKIGIVKAIGKVIWIQNDLLARWHMDEGKAYADEQFERETEVRAQEQEGYLNGKKALGDSSEDDALSMKSGDSGRTSLGRNKEEVEEEPIGCPFSGLQERQRAIVSPTRGHHEPRTSASGIPRLHVENGKTVNKEKLGPNPFNDPS